MFYQTRRMQALTELRHARHLYQPGEEFLCTPTDCDYYTSRGKAKALSNLPEPAALSEPPSIITKPAVPAGLPVVEEEKVSEVKSEAKSEEPIKEEQVEAKAEATAEEQPSTSLPFTAAAPRRRRQQQPPPAEPSASADSDATAKHVLPT